MSPTNKKRVLEMRRQHQPPAYIAKQIGTAIGYVQNEISSQERAEKRSSSVYASLVSAIFG